MDAKKSLKLINHTLLDHFSVTFVSLFALFAHIQYPCAEFLHLCSDLQLKSSY